MIDRVAIAAFQSREEARMMRDALEDAGFQAWLEGPASGIPGEHPQDWFRVEVPVEDAEEARFVLSEPLAELPGGDEPHRTAARPLWIPVVAALVLVSFVLVYAVQYDFLWPWILLTGLVGFLVWRAVGPRRP